MKDILDWLDEHEREDIRQEKLERIYRDPDTWDRQWDLIKEEEIESTIRNRK